MISGPSGAGKGTLIARALSELDGLVLSVSATTRPPREGEKNGQEYLFLSRSCFRRWIREGRFLEWAAYDGHLYGTPRRPVEENLQAGRDVILEIELDGAKQVLERVPDAAFVFIMPPSMAELERRLEVRGTERRDAVQRRLSEAHRELEEMTGNPAWLVGHQHYVIVNDDADSAAKELVKVINEIREAARSGCSSSSEVH